MVAGGSVVAAVGAMYGAKQFTPSLPRAVAQTPAQVVAPDPERKPDTEPKPAKDDDIIPSVVSAPIKPAEGSAGGPALNPVKAPKLGPDGKPIPDEVPGTKDGEKGDGLDIVAPLIPAGPGRERQPDARAEAATREAPKGAKDAGYARPAAGATGIASPPSPGPLPSDINIPEAKPGEREYRAPQPPPVPGGDKPESPAGTGLVLPDVPLPSTPGDKKDPADDKFKAGAPLPVVKIPGAGAKPPTPGAKPAAAAEDPFKSTEKPAGGSGDDLPTINMNSKIKPGSPVVPAGGTDTTAPDPAKKAGDPAGVKLEFDPPVPPPPAAKPDIPKLDELPDAPPVPAPRKDAAPTLPPIPGIDEKGPAVGAAPVLPAVPMLPEVKLPTVKVPDTAPPTPGTPKIEVGPAPMTPKIEVGPAPLPPVGVAAPAEPAKKDSYEEDWHTPDSTVNTYVGISNFYYKTPDYAKALEAYNRDRKKPGESIVRVPPTWVLDEKFPNLTGKSPTPPGVTFDKVEPAGGTRPAPVPAPAAGTSDEYRVTAEAGEKIKDIARTVYGDPNAWRKLTDLNPNLDPTEPIPAGTTLRVKR